ncbi:MAG TPA: ABC transporter permease, partial [Pyrinomonadaceae bacterium]|nr:ABC transporter permease [Pyrinomonadaceae bacterium]
MRVLTEDKGFDAEQLLTANVALPLAKYDKPEQQARFFHEFLERVKGVPGVEGAAAVNNIPLGGGGTNGGVPITGRAYAPDQLPNAEKSIISPDFFGALRTPIARGRAFTERDDRNAPQVAIINEAFARKYFPGEDPVGKSIDFNWNTKGTQEIVGVVRDVKQYGLDTPAGPTVYVPYLQRAEGEMTVVVRSQATPASLVAALRQQLAAVDKEQPLAQVRTMREVVAESVAQRRVLVMVFALFALIALVVAAVGIYGVMSYSVTQRTHEIGVRMALGAQASDVLRLVVGQGMTLALVGLGLGLAGTYALTRLMASLLYGVTPHDPATFISVSALLAGVALLACYIPVRRA